jgi:hypothetical protein
MRPEPHSHPHWLRSERSASASWATPGKTENGSPEAEPIAPRGRSRLNLRKVAIGADDLALVLASQISLLVRVSLLPAATLGLTFQPAVALPASPRVEPAIQFAQARFDGGIDLAKIPEPIALDLEFEKRGVFEDPVGLPMKVPLEEEFPAEVVIPFIRIVLMLPTVKGNGPQRLLDFNELAATAAAAAKVAAMMHDNGTDDGENGFQQWPVATRGGVIAEDVGATPSPLDRPFELDDRVTSPSESVMLTNRGDDLMIGEILGIKHSGGWLVEFGAPGRRCTHNPPVRSRPLCIC